MLKPFFFFFLSLWLPRQVLAQCDSLPIDFAFTYLSEDTVLLLNTSAGFDTYEWTIEGGAVIEEYERSAFVVQQAGSDSISVCLTGRMPEGCQQSLCRRLAPGHPNDYCSNTDCILPGDANGDRRANQYDLLNIGLGFGIEGPERMVFPVPDDPTFWAPVFNENWDESLGPVNFKHLDCDGNGVIDAWDVLAIQNNYTPAGHLQNELTPGATPVGIKLDSRIETQSEDITKATITAELSIGNPNLPVEDLHGLALRLSFPDQPFKIESIRESLPDSGLLGPAGSLLRLEKRLGVEEKRDFFDFALSKKNSSGSDGFGQVAAFNIISADIIELLSSPAIPFKVAIEGLILIDENGDTLSYDIPVDTVCINFIDNISTSAREVILSGEEVQLSPNPSDGVVLLQTVNGLRFEEYTLINMTGQVVEHRKMQGLTREALRLRFRQPGWYVLKIKTSSGLVNKRILLLHK